MSASDTPGEDQPGVDCLHRREAGTFEAMFRSYADELYRFARRYVESPEVAEELVHDVFCHIWTRGEGWRADRSTKSYLYRAVWNQLLDYLKHERVVRQFEQRVAQHGELRVAIGSAPEWADHGVTAAELDRAIRRAVMGLPRRTREAFVLNREQQLTYSQIAEVMQISVKTVETQIGRALKTLRQDLALWLESA